MPALDQKIKIPCGKCGNSVTKTNLSRHKSRSSGGTLLWPKRPNFFTKSALMIQTTILSKTTVFQDIQEPAGVNYVTQNFPTIILYVNTKHSTWTTTWIRSEQYWCGGHSGRCWRSKFEKWNLANTFWQMLKWRIDDTESSTLPCHPPKLLRSTIY